MVMGRRLAGRRIELSMSHKSLLREIALMIRRF